mmetsp:Transcript_70561/g.86563  ORF Transcript_70561/g.86563 Transcript_70561/m.86563 type:complete len:95 (-) Transcript_70561:159-443(-)
MPQHQIGLELVKTSSKRETEYQHMLAAFVELDKENPSISAYELQFKLTYKYGYACVVAKNCPSFSYSWGKFKYGLYNWKLKNDSYNIVIIRGMK